MFCRKKDEGDSGLKERLVKVDDPVLRQKTAEDWANLKKRIRDAIKKDEQPETFEALVTEVNELMKLSVISSSTKSRSLSKTMLKSSLPEEIS